jgi:hypothetical protein
MPAGTDKIQQTNSNPERTANTKIHGAKAPWISVCQKTLQFQAGKGVQMPLNIAKNQ